jgi:hypothetical protein
MTGASWGLIPSWRKDPKNRPEPVNAMSVFALRIRRSDQKKINQVFELNKHAHKRKRRPDEGRR